MRKHRIENALWGLFIGDSLAMPAHWYYNLDNIRKDFGGGVRGYVDPPHPHPESFMVGMRYMPDVEAAERSGRRFDILHEHARFYRTSYSDLTIPLEERESEHGNATPRPEERYHYHHGLRAGDNTTAARLVRVLLRSVIAHGRYDPVSFLEDMVDFLTRPGNNPDPYCEIFLRRWFEHYASGAPITACAESQRSTWSIGSHGGMLQPLVVSMLSHSAYQGAGLGLEHQQLTHRSENVAAALWVTIPLLHDLLRGDEMTECLRRFIGLVRPPRVTGRELYAMYREHDGPENIPAEEMWRLHTRLADAPLDADELAGLADEDVVNERFASACYPEHGLPLLLFLLLRHGNGFESALLANVNAGGDNVHRGMVLGMLAGAAGGEIPETLRAGLRDAAEIGAEIDAFSRLAVTGEAF